MMTAPLSQGEIGIERMCRLAALSRAGYYRHDDFASIVKTIRPGRRIYDNLRKTMGYIFAVHVPIAGMSPLSFVLGSPLVFALIHVVFLEMVIDPVCSVVFEEGDERDVMHWLPRKPAASPFSISPVGWSLIQGMLTFAVVAAPYVFSFGSGMPDNEVRALAFVSLMSTNVALIFANGSFGASLISAFWCANRVLWLVLAATAALLGIVLAGLPPGNCSTSAPYTRTISPSA